MTEIIGRGERAAREILNELYPNLVWRPQVPLTDLKPASQIDVLRHVSERIRRTSIDWIIYPQGQTWHEAKKIAVHIDDDHHTGAGTSRKDGHIDKILLQDYKIPSLRIREHNCPHLFKDETGPEARQELEYEIMAWHLHKQLIEMSESGEVYQ